MIVMASRIAAGRASKNANTPQITMVRISFSNASLITVMARGNRT